MDTVTPIDQVEPSLEELALLWKAMPRTSDKEQQESEAFYKEKVFPLVLTRICNGQQGRLTTGYDLLISPLGTSPEPLIITISLLKPARVVFLCSPATEKFIESIREQTGMDGHCLHKHYVEKDDALPIYEAVHTAIQEEGKRLRRAPRVAIDMTGGTKLMGAGCAMAGVLIGADIYYVAGDFDPLYRRPVPGTENLVQFQDPYAEFGHLQADQAMARFARHDYAGAAQIFEEIADQVAKPRTYQCLGHLSRAYEAWDALRLDSALENLGKACSIAQKFRSDGPIMKSLPVDILESQRTALDRLHTALAGSKLSLSLLQDPEVYAPLLFTIVESAARCEERETYEAASLLLYRAIEMMAQRRLALSGFDTANADYACLGLDPAEAGAQINSELKLNRPVPCPLPIKVSLYLAHVLLAWQKDAYTTGKPPLNLGHLNQLISLRNEGLYAHGFKPTEKGAHGKFRDFTNGCLERLCQAEGWDIEQLRAQCRFIRLPAISVTSY